MKAKSIAIIPARYGSKRLPLKNFRLFLGKPIITYTIEAALESGIFDVVVVSSDHPELESVYQQENVILHKREPKLSTDSSRVVDVVDSILQECPEYNDVHTICVLYPTAPLRNSNHLIEMANKFMAIGVDSLHAVTTYDLPVHQAITLQGSRCEKVFPDIFHQRYDNVPSFFVDNGSTYFISRAVFEKINELIADEFGIYEMCKQHSIDLDTEADWELLEFYAKKEEGVI